MYSLSVLYSGSWSDSVECCLVVARASPSLLSSLKRKFISTVPAQCTVKTSWSRFISYVLSFCQSLFLTFSLSLSPYVGQSMCIDIFSVYWSPESRIGDHPRNRLSHFNILQKWSGQVLSSISLSFTGSPPFSIFHTISDEDQASRIL